MTDWNTVSAFMANVVAWPASQDAGFVNLHYSMPNPQPTPSKPLIKGMGWPYTTVDALVQRAAWLNTVADKFKDVWFCLSTQSMAGKNKRGNPKAIRLAANATKVKSIWVDIDVGVAEPGKPPKYETVSGALKAILLFQTTVGLPPPSAIVYSGGGIHVYWISKDPLDPAAWATYASGLKHLLLANSIRCDAGLTTDIARILRMPGTFNHKYDPPKPVSIAPLPLIMYEFDKKLAFLQQFAGPVAQPMKVAHQLFADGADMASFKAMDPVFAGLDANEQLGAGVDKHAEHLLDPRPIFTECGFLKQALKTGGADYDNPLWNLSVLCTTFMENGNEIAHKISNGHVSYSEVDTQALYDRKVADRHDRGIGYPSCSTIAGNGCKSCASCPLFPKGKSPLNIAPKPKPFTATVNVQSPQAAAVGLPATFELNPEGIICKVVETEDDGAITTELIPLFQCVMSNFWLQKHPGEQLNFTMTVDKGFSEQATVDLGKISANAFKAYLGERRVLIDTRGIKYLEEFFLSIIGKLRALMAAQQSVPFGWYEEKGAIRGFAFGGKLLLDDGTERMCGSADPNIAMMYQPTGDIQKWFDAAATVTNRKRPELTTIMLMSFASPLLYLNGKNSLMLSAYGRDSGAGKTSAYRVGMGVWGDPLLTKGTESGTVNSITTQMKTIRHLPFYWDEITDDEHRERVAKVMHEADGGKEKSRNLDGVRTQAVGKWKLMMHVASNGSYREFLRKRNVNTVASLSRCLEWEVKRIDGGPGWIPDADAEALLIELERNYGMMGMRYAQYLAQNHVRITDEIRRKVNETQLRLCGSGKGNTERLWYTGVALLSLAAKYAADVGVDVDPVEIEAFMTKVYMENLAYRDNFSPGGNVDNSESVLTRYLKERDAQERIVWTNYMHNSRGKPPKPVLVVHGPTQARNHNGGVEVRFAIENGICVIARSDFNAYLAYRKEAETQIYAALTQVYGLTNQKLQICGGWVHNAGREDCIVLHIPRNTPMWDYMTSFLPPEEKDKVDDGEEAETVDTGLTSPGDVAAFVRGATARAA